MEKQLASGGSSATVSGDDITINGQTLTAILLSSSTGVGAGHLRIEITTNRINGSWYVTDANIDVG